MQRLRSLAAACLGAIPFVHLVAGCTFHPPEGTPPFYEGFPPLTSAIFCDIEAHRRCATADDILMGIDVTKPFEAGFWADKSNAIGLDYRPEALAACAGKPQAVVYVDAFPTGTPVCINPGQLAAGYHTVNEACQAWCAEQGMIDSNGHTFICSNIAWQSNGASQPFADACTQAGTLRPDFADPRRIKPAVMVQWTDALGLQVMPNFIRKNVAAGWGNAGAVSVQQLASGDGRFMVKAGEPSLRIFGLGHVGDPNVQSFEDIDFALLLTQAGTLLVLELGVVQSPSPVGTYALGDDLEIAVEEGAIVYKKNGAVLFTRTPASIPYPLQADVALNFEFATIVGAKVVF